jgi:hypothetical protein
MRRGNIRAGVVGLVGVGALALALVGGAQVALAGPSSTRLTRETVTVVAIDRVARTMTLQNIDGETKTVDVPTEVRAFDTVKIGDHVDIDYTESMAVSVLPPGSKPSAAESTAGLKTSPSGASSAHQMSVSAEIVSIDRANNKVTFKGPKGNTQTVSVADPAMQRKLPSLKPGQVVQLTYTEAVAAAIRPSPMATPPAQKTP